MSEVLRLLLCLFAVTLFVAPVIVRRRRRQRRLDSAESEINQRVTPIASATRRHFVRHTGERGDEDTGVFYALRGGAGGGERAARVRR